MSVLTTVRTANKTHQCSHCLSPIRPGERYEDHRMTPNDEMNDGTAWRRSTRHLPTDCPITRGEGAAE